MKNILFALALSLALPLMQLQANNIRPGDIQKKTISILDGLSSSNVTCISSDQDGHLWVGTDEGFNIINNGHVFPFSQYQQEGDTLRRRIGKVEAMAVSQHRALIASESGLLLFDNKTGNYKEILQNGRSMEVTAIAELGDGKGGFYLFDSASNCLFLSSVENGELRLVRDFGENVSYRFGKILTHPEKEDVLFFADDEKGVFTMPISSGKLTKVVPGDEKIVAKSCILDNEGRIWVSKFGKGFSSYPVDGRHNIGTSLTTANSELPSDYVNSALLLTNGNIAVSTDAGVCVINRPDGRIESITDHSAWFSTALFTTSPLELIVGTRFNGIHELRRTSLHSIGHSHDASGFSLPAEVILSSLPGHDGDLWLGTAGGGLYLFNEYERSLETFKSTQGNQISSICNLNENTLLAVSRFEGLKVFNKKDSGFAPYHLNCMDASSDGREDYVNILLSNAADGSILIFNLDGRCCRLRNGQEEVFQLFPMDSKEKIDKVFSHRFTNVLVGKRKIYAMDNRDELWLRTVLSTDEDILSSTIDDECNIWFITRSGVYRHVLSTSETERVVAQDKDHRFNGIQYIDDQVWLSGRDRCLYRYSVKDKVMSAFSEEDGILPGNDFSGMSFRSENACYFAGLEGVVAAVPSESPVPVRSLGFDIECLTMAVDGKTARYEKGNYVLPKQYNRAILILSVISPSAITPALFRYEMVDRSGHVIASSEVSDPVVSIGRLPSGVHSLRVSSFDGNGWTGYKEVARILRTSDLLPESLVVFVLSFLLAALCLYLYTMLMKRNKEKASFKDYVDTIKNDNRKIRADFNANVVREISSPLTMISDQLKSIMAQNSGNDVLEKQLKDVLHQAGRLKGWLGIIHPFTQTGISYQRPGIEVISIDECLQEIMNDNAMSAKNRKLILEYIPSSAPLVANTNRGYFSDAIGMFILNAFVNHAKSTVRISSSTTNLGYVRVSVIDDGDSYPGDYDDLFSSSSGMLTSDGFSAMGLAAVRARLESIGGKVSGYRNVDQGGSTFYVDVPVAPDKQSAAEAPVAADSSKPAGRPEPVVDPSFSPVEVPEIGEYENVSEMLDVDSFDTKDQTLLIVDDEPDVREYLSTVYASRFKTIYVAADGKEGLEVAREKQPNIIVSDVKMPKMNGFEFCKAVKSDIEISHLPFILLTSLAESKSQEIGYKMGADVFIPKPFDTKMLYNAIQTQLRNRYEIKKRYFSSALPEITEEQTFSAADESFVLKLNKFINDNISNPDLNIDMILNEMCVSRSTLFNKMNSIIGVSAARYIKNIRVERAKNLLSKTSMTIFEVASEVGFTESQYFSTVFKQETGFTPSQYRSQNSK
ncbi:MAG: response regulator [Bacteroidales bacterium]|nr:response regulator [Bacteroidales bacterium]